MAEPVFTDLIAACETLLESVPSRKFKVLNPEETISFDNGENPDVLRSDLDLVTAPGSADQFGRINAWIVSEQSFSQSVIPFKTGTGSAPIGQNRVVYTLRLEYFYEFAGGVAAVRAVCETVRQLFNQYPRLGLGDSQAQFIDQRHGGLQLVLAAEGDFRTAIAFIRTFTLTVPVMELSI